MALYIRDDRVRELAAALATRQGRTVTETVRAALLDAQGRLDEELAARDAEARDAIAKLRAMRRESVREEALYDDQGQPVR